jgi:hypothetical protein
MQNNKNITLYKNKPYTLPNPHFERATDGSPTTIATQVTLLWQNNSLQLQFHCQHNPFVHQNTYIQHNSPMWNQEVFEIFLTTAAQYPQQYLEIELNPNNALFVGWITNPSGQAPDSCSFLSPQASGITHQVSQQASSWQGSINIPLALLGHDHNNLKINLYRIVSLHSQPNPNWACSPANSEFLCYNSTHSGTEPRFHIPTAFVNLHLV